MGRIVDLCAEIAANADEGEEGLVLPVEVRAKLRADWPDEDIDDALSFVHDSLLQSELVEAADSLSARLVEVLGAFGDAQSFARLVEGGQKYDTEVVGQLARRLDRLEEILESFREEKGPDRRGLDALKRRLMDQGIEKEMQRDDDGEGEED
jgi:hypothetical protein